MYSTINIENNCPVAGEGGGGVYFNEDVRSVKYCRRNSIFLLTTLKCFLDYSKKMEIR